MIAVLNNVNLFANNKTILNNVDINIDEGNFFCLFGDTNAGKTSFLHVLCGLCKPNQGMVEVCGKDPFYTGKDLRFLPDDIIWENLMSGKKYLDFCKENSSLYNAELETKLCKHFQVSVKERLTDMTYRNNKMVQIIGAISSMPKLLVLDEPKNFLDKITFYDLLEYLEHLCINGMTIVITAKTYQDIRGFCTHYAYLKEGNIMATSKVPVFDYRKKIITFYNATKSLKESISKISNQKISEYKNKSCYLYEKNINELGAILTQEDYEDMVIEELTLEEELNQDYSRWEIKQNVAEVAL